MTDTIPLEFLPSPGFAAWLDGQRLALALTTHRTGRLLLVGLDPEGRLAVSSCPFDRATGLCVHGRQLYLATLAEIWRFDDALRPGQAWQGHDRLYVPQLCWATGILDAHDLAVDGRGRPWFANTLFSCLAGPSPGYSFAPLWQPPWITELLAEDRCHLNGLAMAEGRPAFVTAVARTDVAKAWRERRRDGGVVVAVQGGAVVLEGLSMPHSPRWHRGRLWLLDSGRGILGWLDRAQGALRPVAFCPGFARGLALHGDFAVVGLSKPRASRAYNGLELDDALAARGLEPRCGLMVVDLRTGEVAHTLWIEGAANEELYDIAALPGARRPAALEPGSAAARGTIVPGPPGDLA